MAYVILVVWLALSGAAGAYAGKKGRGGAGVFFLSLLLSPLVGLVVAFAMRPDEQKIAAAQGKKRCPDCAELVQPETKVCRFCEHNFTEAEQPAAAGLSSGPSCPKCASIGAFSYRKRVKASRWWKQARAQFFHCGNCGESWQCASAYTCETVAKTVPAVAIMSIAVGLTVWAILISKPGSEHISFLPTSGSTVPAPIASTVPKPSEPKAPSPPGRTENQAKEAAERQGEGDPAFPSAGPQQDPRSAYATQLRTILVGRGYLPIGNALFVAADSEGNHLFVQQAACNNVPDNHCQKLFIAFNGRFLGTDTFLPSWQVHDIADEGVGNFSAVYEDLSDPSRKLPPVKVVYTWDGQRLTALGTPPTRPSAPTSRANNEPALMRNPSKPQPAPVVQQASVEGTPSLGQSEGSNRQSQPTTSGLDSPGLRSALQSGGVYDVGGNVMAPVPIYDPDPPYSEEARKAKYSGTVSLIIIIDASGTVTDAQVTKPAGFGLDEKAIETAKTWKFKPAMRNGSPVRVRCSVEESFRLF